MEEQIETNLSMKTLTVGLILLIYTICSFVFTKINFHYIHESGICILLGALISIITYVFNEDSKYNLINFDEEIFFNLILPPIIFAAGYNLRKRAFFKFFSYSFIFGVLGTFLTFSFTTICLYLFNSVDVFSLPYADLKSTLKMNVYEILAFSAIISATDTVAPLTFIKEDQKPKLFAILFGEGVLNDAVCIVLYKIINSMAKNNLSNSSIDNSDNNILTFSSLFKILAEFSYLFVLSLLLGAISGLICSYSLKKLKYYQPNRTQETTIIILFAFITYSAAELIHLSSVIALLFSGIFMSQYAYLNLSFQAREESCVVAKILSNFAEAFVFCYLGLSCMSIQLSYISYSFIIIVFFLLILGRTITVYFVGFVVNHVSCLKMNVNSNEKTIMSFSGYVRGAISYGLAITIKSNSEETRNVLITTCLIIVFLTTLFMGGIIPLVIKKINSEELEEANRSANPLIFSSNNSSFISNNSNSSYLNQDNNVETFSIQRFDKIDNSINNDNDEDIESTNYAATSKIKSFWKKLDDSYLKPCFIDDWPEVKRDHNEISRKMIELFSLHQQKKIRSKEMSGLMAKVQEKKESLVKFTS